jgi:ABC-type multidrug transport system ATPase subunit
MRSGHTVAATAPVVCAGVGVRHGPVWTIRLASFMLTPSDLGTATLAIMAPAPEARTTLVALLSGRAAPTYGSLAVLGNDMRTTRGRTIARRQVGLARRGARIWPAIRIRGHVERAARIAGRPESDRHLLVAAIIDRLGLSPWADVELRSAPELVARKAWLAAACVHQPKLLLIDGLLDQLGNRDRTVLADAIDLLRGDTAIVVLGGDADALSLASDRVLSLANGILTGSGYQPTVPLPADNLALS